MDKGRATWHPAFQGCGLSGQFHSYRLKFPWCKSVSGCEDQIFTPTPNPEFLSKDFPSATRSRMEILTKEDLVGPKTAPTAVSRTLTPLVRRIRFP